MPKSCRVLFCAAIEAAILLAQPAAASADPLSRLVTTYRVPNANELAWVTCGATATTEGCFQSGTMENLPNVCSMLEGPQHTETDTAETFVGVRLLFVMYAGTTVDGAGVAIYWKTDTLTSSYDTTVIKLVRKIPLPLTGGAGVSCSMARNDFAVFMGTNKSYNAAKLTTPGYAVTTVPGFSSVPVSQISASDTGFVTVNFGSAGFDVYGPTGNMVEDGGGNALTPNAIQGLPLSPSSPSAPSIVAHHNFVAAAGE